uniref:Uncharacterized protein n=1 Tax=Aegilops tauschii subsp. strangulata TaxID=200361 RepID=A0A453MSZ4_AEGTS
CHHVNEGIATKHAGSNASTTSRRPHLLSPCHRRHHPRSPCHRGRRPFHRSHPRRKPLPKPLATSCICVEQH